MILPHMYDKDITSTFDFLEFILVKAVAANFV